MFFFSPLILDEPVHTAPQIDKEAFFKKVGKGVLKLYREHKMDTEQLNCTQVWYPYSINPVFSDMNGVRYLVKGELSGQMKRKKKTF